MLGPILIVAAFTIALAVTIYTADRAGRRSGERLAAAIARRDARVRDATLNALAQALEESDEDEVRP